jgi:hypothetical protein
MTKEQIEFINENFETKGPKYCADKLSINKSTISSYARRNGLKVSKESIYRILSKNSIYINKYINVVDPDIAYILGLIWSDGNVSFANNNSKTPIIKHTCVKYDSLNSDLIFEKLNWRRFESENMKSLGKNTMIANWVSSRELGNYLISNNYRDKDLGTYIFENFNNLLSHFLRGFFDGDGCITISNSGLKYKQIAIYFSSTHTQDWTFITKILDSLSIKYKTRINTDKLGKSSQIYINDSKSIYNLCEFIYKDSDGIRLERKYDKYKDFLEYKKIFKRNNNLNSLLKYRTW